MAEDMRADNEDTISYRYQVLPKRAIRLLKIPKESIYQPWTLTAYELEECPSYISLSYTWGPPLDTEECKREYEDVKRSLILRSGNITGSLGIGRNLWEGLEQLIAAGYTGHIWADAICINQKDIPEQSSQVSLMGRIYGECTRVAVWLGKDQSYLSDFSWFHETLLPALEKHFDEGGFVSGFFKVVTSANSGKDTVARWHGYTTFYQQHRWFHRCWIMQEVALAREVDVLCGSASLDFQDICDMAMFLHDMAVAVLPADWKLDLHRTELIKTHKGHAIASQRAVCRLPYLRDLDWIPSTTGAGTPLQMCYGFCLSAMSAVRGYQATNPRDKVYAALGMATKFLPPGEEAIIIPDYSLSTSEVYKMVTAFFIFNLPNLAVLSHVEDKSIRVLLDLPSWVPDFSPEIVASTYASRYDRYPHNACSSEIVGMYPRSVADSTLQLYGAPFDTVTLVVEGTESYRLRAERSLAARELQCMEICLRLLNFCSCLEHRYINGQTRVEALSKTIILNQVDGRPPLSEESEMFRDWLLAMLAVTWASLRLDHEAHGLFQSCCKSLEILEETRDGTLPNEDVILEYSRMRFTNEITVVERKPKDASPVDMPPGAQHDSVWQNYRLYDRGLNKGVFLQQRLYKTSKGCIGLGPPSMHVGDQIYFICDATVPFVLRSKQNTAHHTLIGETYLHGFMNGEALRDDFKDRIGPICIV
jgi:Heterokaryon incompatibility protein (HET)